MLKKMEKRKKKKTMFAILTVTKQNKSLQIDEHKTKKQTKISTGMPKLLCI